jgi:hypothetical protein
MEVSRRALLWHCRLTGRPPTRRSCGVEALGLLLVIEDPLAVVQEVGCTLCCDADERKLEDKKDKRDKEPRDGRVSQKGEKCFALATSRLSPTAALWQHGHGMNIHTRVQGPWVQQHFL